MTRAVDVVHVYDTCCRGSKAMVIHERLAERMRETIAGFRSPLAEAFLTEWPKGGRRR
jgi:hypothetical protein